jgi:hypothetical protein
VANAAVFNFDSYIPLLRIAAGKAERDERRGGLLRGVAARLDHEKCSFLCFKKIMTENVSSL